MVINVSGPTGGAGGAGPDMAVDKIADDFDTGTRSLMMDVALYDERWMISGGGLVANAQRSLGWGPEN